MPNQLSGFWSISLGNIVGTVTMLLALWSFHQSNKTRIKDSVKEFEELKNKIAQVHTWFTTNSQSLEELKIKVDLMYSIWFKDVDINAIRKTH